MPSNSKKPLELSRITLILDTFDEKIIKMMAEKRKQSHSEIVRNLVHNWIETNPNILRSNYDIDLIDITKEIIITDYYQIIQNSIQKLEKYSDSKKSSELSRITFSLDAFDERVISLMAKKKKQSRPETIRNLLHNWIVTNPNILKSNYDKDLNDIKKEIEINQVKQSTIQKLIMYSELFNEIEFDILAEQLSVSRKILRDMIFGYKDQLEENGIKFRFMGKLIIKE